MQEPSLPASNDDSVLIRLEVLQASTSSAGPNLVSTHVEQLLRSRRLKYTNECIPFAAEDDEFLLKHVVSISIVDTETDQEAPQGTQLLFWQARLSIHNTGQGMHLDVCKLPKPATSFFTHPWAYQILMLQVQLEIHVFQLSEEGPADDDEPEDDVSTYRDWLLPALEFHGLWESLI